MTIITEKNHLNPRNELKITRTITVVDDQEYNSKMRAIANRIRRLKQQKLVAYLKKYNHLLKSIQYRQLQALQTDNDRDARVHLEYITMILKPDLAHTKGEIQGLCHELGLNYEAALNCKI